MQMGREKEFLQVLPQNEGRATMRKPLLRQGESLLKKAISLSRLKPVLSSKRAVSDKIRDHHQRYQRDRHKHSICLPVAAICLRQEKLAIQMLVDVMLL